MQASYLQLYEVGPYAQAKASSKVVKGMIMPTPHRAVKLTLLELLEPLTKKMRLTKYGLFHIDAKLRKSGVVPGLRTSADHGKFILCRLFEVEDRVRNHLVARQFHDNIVDDIAAFVRRIERIRSPNHWCWVQHTDENAYHTYVIWDAEKDGLKITPARSDAALGNEALKLVLGAFICENAQWKCIYEADGLARTNTEKIIKEKREKRKTPRSLAPSLLSSFSIKGYPNSFDNWPSPIVACELYTFMQRDVRRIWNPLTRLDFLRRSVIHFTKFTEVIHRENISRRIPALRAFHLPSWLKLFRGQEVSFKRQWKYPWTWPMTPVTDWLARCSTRDLKKMAIEIKGTAQAPIIGLASYFPELTSFAKHSRRTGRKALSQLVELASLLRSNVNPVLTVEAVAGSLVDGIWPGIDEEDKEPRTTFVANVMSDEVAFARLTRSLFQPAQLAVKYGLQIALELEPGPLFILRDLDTLNRFATKHLQEEPWRSAIGFNLDIGHWSLSGATPAMVREFPAVFERICHVHVSKCRAGHFGDLPLRPTEDEDDDETVSEWLDLVDEVRANGRYGGYVSCELEAAVDMEDVKKTTEYLACFGVAVPPKSKT
jgi:sugar phosphate isomerase/epimerase